MDRNQKELYTIRYLLSKSLEGNAMADEMQQLDTLIIENPKARRYYVEFLHLHVSLRKLLQKDLVELEAERDEVLDVDLWDALARHEQIAETIIVESDDTQIPIPSNMSKGFSSPAPRKLSKFSMVSIAASIAAALFIVLYLSLVPVPGPIVATLSDSINAQWSNPNQALKAGDDIRAQAYYLQSGMISLRFECGAEIVIEGPAECSPISINKMALQSGKVFAHVPKTAIGFTIDTPQSSVVDLGTDFGITVNPVIGSQVHVYQGKVNLIAGQADQPKQSEILLQKEARNIDADRGIIRPAEFKEYLFARKISSKDNHIEYGPPISLASLVAGGDGLTPGDQPSGIDPSTGHVHQVVEEDFGRIGSGTYCLVADRPFVDGVFVPNGTGVVSSAGHTFKGFPATTNSFWSDITTSPIFNYFETNEDDEVLYKQQFVATLDSASETDTEKPIILMHANSGITFDLNEIRKAFPDAQIVGFTARCGISKNALTKMKHDFWILLDGQRVFHYHQPAGDETSKTIRVSISVNQQYLTLATTDGGDNTSFDWCLFESAVLELVPKSLISQK